MGFSSWNSSKKRRTLISTVQNIQRETITLLVLHFLSLLLINGLTTEWMKQYSLSRLFHCLTCDACWCVEAIRHSDCLNRLILPRRQVTWLFGCYVWGNGSFIAMEIKYSRIYTLKTINFVCKRQKSLSFRVTARHMSDSSNLKRPACHRDNLGNNGEWKNKIKIAMLSYFVPEQSTFFFLFEIGHK